MPTVVQCLDDTANNKLSTFSTTGSEQHMKVMFTVLPAFKLIKDSLWKWLEALGTHKALWVPDLTVGVDDLLVLSETLTTPAANANPQIHVRTSE